MNLQARVSPFFLSILAIFLICQSSFAPAASLSRVAAGVIKADQKEETVYITRTGKKYHRSGCVHLRQSKIPVSRQKAKESGYTPCKHCMPDS